MEISAIIKNLQAGDLRSQQKFYDYAYTYVYNICSLYFRNKQDVEDMTLETLTKLLSKIQLLITTDESSFHKWLYVITHNLCKDVTRYNVLRRNINNEYIAEYEDFLYKRYSYQPIIIDDVLNSIEHLPPMTKTVFKLFVDGYTHKEISQKYNIKESTSQWHVYSAREFLRKKHKDYGY